MNPATPICAAALLAASFSTCRADPTTLRLGVIANSMHSFPATVFDVARREGMLDREGLKLVLVPLAGVGHMITALDDNSVELSSTAVPYLIEGELRGSQAVALVGGPANTIYSLVARPNVKTFADLKGKTIGLSLPTDIISIGTRKLLAKHGLRASDYVAKQLVGTPVRAKCLMNGDCAATPLTQPDDLELASKGYHILGTSHEVIPDLQFTVIAARRSWAKQHEDSVVRFARAMGEAYAFMQNPKNRDTVIEMATTTTGAPKKIVAETYDLYYRPDLGVMPKHAEIDMKGLREAINLLVEAGEIKSPPPPVDKVADLQFLKAAGMQR